MAYEVKRTDEEINDQLNRGAAWEEAGGSSVPGMSFESGVLAGIRWAIGDSEDAPIESDPEE